jgi:hypothetical protein
MSEIFDFIRSLQPGTQQAMRPFQGVFHPEQPVDFLVLLLRHSGDPNVMDLIVRIGKHNRAPLMS